MSSHISFPLIIFIFLLHIHLLVGFKLSREQQQLLNEVEQDEAHLQDPYIGGYNSDKAEILIVNFIQDSSLYKPDLKDKYYKQKTQDVKPQHSKKHVAKRTFKEMVKDYQEMLLTGGIHTNIFKSDNYQITIAVNDKDTVQQVKQFWLSQDEVESVRYKKKTYFKKGKMPKKIKEKQKQEVFEKQKQRKINSDL